ncbi:MAG: DUF2313 domain-containing protein [Oscillospiraceae bacterium]|jgi:hypothetical protein|nr:DUF2313 domain-containing protein [Oscillospiraceae bacterium]
MRHADNIRDLLRPVGVYRLEGGFQAAEWETVGAALDGVFDLTTFWERETQPAAARETGLLRWLSLLPRRPAGQETDLLAAALLALLAVGADSFTPAALEAALQGCGLPAHVSETDVPQTVQVSFPGVPGVPEGFDGMRAIIEDILPCHLDINYRFWFLSWPEWETLFPTWQTLDETGYVWREIETLVEVGG